MIKRILPLKQFLTRRPASSVLASVSAAVILSILVSCAAPGPAARDAGENWRASLAKSAALITRIEVLRVPEQVFLGPGMTPEMLVAHPKQRVVLRKEDGEDFAAILDALNRSEFARSENRPDLTFAILVYASPGDKPLLICVDRRRRLTVIGGTTYRLRGPLVAELKKRFVK